MARKLGLVLVLAAALAVVAWLLAGPSGLLRTGSGGEEAGASTGPSGEAHVSEAPVPDDAAASKASGLAARRPERRGIGSLAARVVDPKQAPIAEARLRVTGTGYAGEAVALEAASDADGRVEFAQVPAGVGYALRVEAAGQPALVVPDVEVRAAHRTDLGAIVVGARAALAGRVVDEKGAAVAGADVRAFSVHENLLEMLGNLMETFVSLGREPTALARATSDADGRFTLADLPPGAVLVRATSARTRAGFAKARMTPDGPAEGALTIRLEPGAIVSGTVVEAGGTPVPGATVAVLSQSPDPDAPEGDAVLAFDFFDRRVFVTTDGKGAFALRVPEGVKDLRAVVEAAGFPTTISREFAAGDTDVRIVMARGSVLEVTALDAATGKPVAGAQVVAMVNAGSSPEGKEGGGILYGVTDDLGVAALPTGAGKLQMLIVQHPSYAATMASPAQKQALRAMGSPAQDDGADVPEEVKAGETARATVRLKAGVRLVGRVTDAAGAPIAGAEVKPVSFFGAGGGKPGRTDAEGNYVVEGLTGAAAQASAMVSFRAPGYVGETVTLRLTPELLAAGEVRRDVRLRRAATLRGRVLDEDGKPVAGARVRHTGALLGGFDLASMFGPSGALTDADGAYVLTEVPPADAGGARTAAPAPGEGEDQPFARLAGAAGELRVAVTAEGFVPARSAALRVREGEDVAVPAIRLSRGAVARGVVRLPGGRPAGGARVEARLDPEGGPADVSELIRNAVMAGRSTRTVRADAEGRFEVAGLAPGTLVVVAKADGYAPSRRKAKVGQEPVELDVALRPAADLSGRVQGSEGAPLVGATVAVEGGLVGVEGDEGYVEPASVVTGGDGRFTLKALPAGSVTVRVRAKGHQAVALSAVPGGAPLDVRLEVRTAKRSREDVQKELQEVSTRYATAKDDDERKAAQRRMTELIEEMNDDAGDGGDAGDAASPQIVVEEK